MKMKELETQMIEENLEADKAIALAKLKVYAKCIKVAKENLERAKEKLAEEEKDYAELLEKDVEEVAKKNKINSPYDSFGVSFSGI